MKSTYRCSICDREVPCDGPLPALYPFCSERCKMVDLGRWFTDYYSIDRDLDLDVPGESLPPTDEPRVDPH